MKIPSLQGLGYHQSVKVRRILAAVLVACAALSWLWPQDVDSTHVLVFKHDLPAGHMVTEEDVVVKSLPEEVVPAQYLSAQEEVLGHHLTVDTVAGEIITGPRISGETTLSSLGEDMTNPILVPVRVADVTSASLVKHGDIITVLREHEGESIVVATGGRVVYTDPELPDTVVVLLEEELAHNVAALSLSSPLTIVITG